MKKINGGATLWARQTIDSDIFFWKPDKWFKIWFYIVNSVNFVDVKQFKRGSGLFTYQQIQDRTGCTRGQADSFVRYAKLNKMLTTRKTTRGMVITVCNYNIYQDFNNYKNETHTTGKREKMKQHPKLHDTENDTEIGKTSCNNKGLEEINLDTHDSTHDIQTIHKRHAHDTISKNDKNDKNEIITSIPSQKKYDGAVMKFVQDYII